VRSGGSSQKDASTGKGRKAWGRGFRKKGGRSREQEATWEGITGPQAGGKDKSQCEELLRRRYGGRGGTFRKKQRDEDRGRQGGE